MRSADSLFLRAFAALLMLTLFIAPDAAAQRGRTSASATAQHVTIMDGETGTVLLCDDCETPIPPASMSKLMTVLLVVEHIQRGDITLDTRYPVSEYAWREHGAPSGGSHMFLPINTTHSVRDLLRGAIIVSANDACVVLAEGIAGSEAAFVEQMNRRAQELGLRSAHFSNATGLDDPGHRISSADLARLARYIMLNHPETYRLYSQETLTYAGHTQENRNPLLGAFAGADGMKTGHTDDSGYGLVGSATRDGHRRIIVFNGTPSMAARRSEALRLMTAAFADFRVVHVAAAGDSMGEARVWLGGRATVPLLAQGEINIAGPRNVQSGVTAHVVYDGPLPAPIKQGDVVAHLVIEGPAFERQEFPLVAGRNVGRANWFARAWEGLRLTLFGPS